MVPAERMPVKLFVVVVVAVLTLSLAAISFVPTVRASTALPTLSTGDYWTYNLTGFNFGIGQSGSGSYKFNVVGTESVTAGGTSYMAYHEKLNVTVTVTQGSTTTTLSIPGDQWLRTSDLATVKESLSISFLGASITETRTNTPPPMIQWPLTSGAAWNDSYMVTAVSVLGSIISTTFSNATSAYSVGTDASITVPAGTFTATPLKQTAPDGSYNVSYWSATVGAPVKEDTVGAFGATGMSLQLSSYSHAAGVGGLFLGLPILAWIGIVAVVIVVIAAVVVLRLRKPKMPQGMPPAQPPMQGMPPQGPGQVPPAPPPQP